MTLVTDMRGHRAHTLWNMTCIIAMGSDLKAESSGWLFKSLLTGGGGIYCGACTTGHTACVKVK